MGVSLVDYRNRLRIDRFFECIQRTGGNGNLLDAALEAGFGSYAQFHRVYRKFLGTTPRDIFSSGANGGVRSPIGLLDAQLPDAGTAQTRSPGITDPQ
jgi:AraC-like DNA-binding protein